MGKVIHGELCHAKKNQQKFDHVNKWFMYNPESVLEIETHKVLWDFQIRIDYLILARQQYEEIVKKKREPAE